MSRVKKLILGHGVNLHRSHPAIKSQVYVFLRIWRNYNHHDYGLERFIRLFLAAILFLTPSLYLKQLVGTYGSSWRKIAIELYVIFKMLFPVFMISIGATHHPFVLLVVIIFLAETITYVTSLIFISDATHDIVQPRRSLALLFANFFEIIFDFAFMYLYFGDNNPGFFSRALAGGTDAVYFSFVTAATVGYGDIAPLVPLAKKLVIIQITLTFVFVGLFLNYFSNLLNKAQNIQTEQKFRKTRHKKKVQP